MEQWSTFNDIPNWVAENVDESSMNMKKRRLTMKARTDIKNWSETISFM